MVAIQVYTSRTQTGHKARGKFVLVDRSHHRSILESGRALRENASLVIQNLNSCQSTGASN